MPNEPNEIVILSDADLSSRREGERRILVLCQFRPSGRGKAYPIGISPERMMAGPSKVPAQVPYFL